MVGAMVETRLGIAADGPALTLSSDAGLGVRLRDP